MLTIKGILHQTKILLPKSHILGCNGVWYSSFWSEEPKNHRNLKILVSKFVPRGFEARRTWGFEAQQHGVSRGGGGVSRHSNMGFRGAATWDLEAQQQVGWDLKGQQRDLEAQQHGTGLSRGYFF